MLTIRSFITKYRLAHVFWVTLTLALIFGIFFLRLSRLPEYLMFLSDQGRDAIVLKRLVTLEKLVFVGPTTSIGNVFTGPFYYYLVAPFMLLSGLHPVGPAFGIALINSFGLVGVFLFVVKKFGRTTGLIFLTLAGLSATQIWQSRYSWNPNPVPLFAFLTLIALFVAIEQKKVRYFALAGMIFGMCLQLHYIAIVMVTPLLAWTVKELVTTIRSHRRHTLRLTIDSAWCLVKNIIVFSAAGVATFTPLIAFEIKNNFINTQTFLRALTTGEIQAKNSLYIDRLRDTCAGFLQHLMLIQINRDIALILLTLSLLVVIYLVMNEKKARAQLILWSCLVIIANVLMLSRLETGRHVHYYNPSYWLAYLVIAYVATSVYHKVKAFLRQCEVYSKTGKFCNDECLQYDERVSEKAELKARCCRGCKGKQLRKSWHIERAMLFVVSLFIIALLNMYVQTQIKTLYFLTDKPKNHTQITHAQNVAQYIIGQISSDSFQVVGLPFYEVEGHYRYFLEYYNRRPMPADALGNPKELFVICHELDKPDCNIPGNPQWQIADFQNRHQNWRVESSKLVEEVRVFKLVYGENDKISMTNDK